MLELIDLIIVRPIINILFIIYGFVGDFGLAIILFTILIKICLWPLMKRQLHQTRLMRKIQPELAEIKKNCKGNRQLESLQMMDLYKRNNIKPFSSILTLIIQIPIFFAIFTAINVMVQPRLEDNLEKRAYAPVRQIESIKEVISLQTPYLNYQRELAKNTDTDLPTVSYEFHPKFLGLLRLDVRPGFASLSAIVILLLTFASALTQFWISRQQLPSRKSQKSKSFRQLMREAADGKEPDQSELNSAMTAQMSVIMPLMMLIVTLNFPGALIFYYFISNIITGLQQKYILGKDAEEMEVAADKQIIHELNTIQEGKVVKENGAKITKISAKSKHKKRGHKQ